jgi:O-antigen biosynthesis protein
VTGTRNSGSSGPATSVVVLSYNSAGYLEPCIRSLLVQDWTPLEILIVDNSSRDASAEVARAVIEKLDRRIKLLPLERNLGCAGGNNAGWKACSGIFVVFLNPDTTCEPGFVRGLIEPMLRHSRVAVTGAKIYIPDTRRLQHAGGITLPNGMTRHAGFGIEDDGQFNEERSVDYVTGAGFAVRRSVLEELGGFDEDYFPAYFEENDLCTRARARGYSVLYSPAAVMYHHESVSLGQNSSNFRRLYQRMRIRYLLKNYSAGDLVRKVIPHEAAWMLRDPEARGHRLEQFRAYAEGLAWLARKGFRPRSR